MTERQIAEKLLVRLRASLPGAVVLKHSDVGTKGIPDVQVAWADRTSWLELKILKRGRTLKGINKAEQLLLCHQLATVNGGRCWVLVFEVPTKTLAVWQPRTLYAHLWPNVVGTDPDHPWRRTEPVPIDSWDPPAGLGATLRTCGAVRGPWSYDAATRLVADALV